MPDDDFDIFGDLDVVKLAAPQSLMPQFVMKSGADISIKPYEWLWPGMLARGKIHALAGRAGLGKTSVMLNVGARLSRGEGFPGCDKSVAPENVIYISNEDGAADTIIPRFIGMGGDRARIFFLDGLLSRDGTLLSIIEHSSWICDQVLKTNAGLLVLDPVTEFCGARMDNNSATHVRFAVGHLQAVAERTNTAVMCITHLTKQRDSEQIDRVLGSGAWTHAPRIVWGAVEEEGQRYLGLMKSNIGSLEHVYPYELSGGSVEGMEVRRATIAPRLNGRILSDFKDIGTPSKREKVIDAVDFIQERLAMGPVEKQQVIKDLQSIGISESTAQRAAREMGVISQRTKNLHGPAIWMLPQST